MKFNRHLSIENKEQYQFLLEANSFELTFFYMKFGADSVDNTGVVTRVGFVADLEEYPVFVHIQPYQHRGVKYLSLEVTGKWADWDLIEAWSKFHFPKALLIDSNNFHKIIAKAKEVEDVSK